MFYTFSKKAGLNMDNPSNWGEQAFIFLFLFMNFVFHNYFTVYILLTLIGLDAVLILKWMKTRLDYSLYIDMHCIKVPEHVIFTIHNFQISFNGVLSAMLFNSTTTVESIERTFSPSKPRFRSCQRLNV